MPPAPTWSCSRPPNTKFVPGVVLNYGFIRYISSCTRRMLLSVEGGMDHEDCGADFQVVNIVVRDPLWDPRMHQGSVEECRGHGI